MRVIWCCKSNFRNLTGEGEQFMVGGHSSVMLSKLMNSLTLPFNRSHFLEDILKHSLCVQWQVSNEQMCNWDNHPYWLKQP